MLCPQCQSKDTKVIDSRVVEDGHTIRRRRECEKCEFRFTTFERKSFADLMVVKKDGTKEFYDREKLAKSISLACAKRKVSKDQIDEIIANLENNRGQSNKEIPSDTIGKDVLVALRHTDPVAYVRFASVYMDFDNFEDFKQII